MTDSAKPSYFSVKQVDETHTLVCSPTPKWSMLYDLPMKLAIEDVAE